MYIYIHTFSGSNSSNIAILKSPSCDVEGNARETDYMQNISRTGSPC